MAGNQQGKSHCGGGETTFHLNGRYPDWWKGKRFHAPIRCWCCGVSHEKTRDVIQRKLFGPLGHFGTGFIPKVDILGEPTMSRGTPGLIDFAEIAHVSGGVSWLSFKSYDQGWEKFTADEIHVAWLDEECSSKIYTEVLARTTNTDGITFMTFTPLMGMTDVVTWFFPEPDSPDRHLTRMEIEDAQHIPVEERARIISRYPPHEREARSKGIPILGEGRVFQVEEELLIEDPPRIPPYWARIVGLDLGYDHPTAAVWVAWDRDADVMHIYDVYRQSKAPIAVHAAAIKGRGSWIPVAWPHDAYRHEQGSGDELARQYREHGVKMLPKHATFPDGGFGLEARVQGLLDYMVTGRLKVSAHLTQWWDEFRLYHRKNGRIVAERDDLMSATGIAFMMLRSARTQERIQLPSRVPDYDPLNPFGPEAVVLDPTHRYQPVRHREREI